MNKSPFPKPIQRKTRGRTRQMVAFVVLSWPQKANVMATKNESMKSDEHAQITDVRCRHIDKNEWMAWMILSVRRCLLVIIDGFCGGEWSLAQDPFLQIHICWLCSKWRECIGGIRYNKAKILTKICHHRWITKICAYNFIIHWVMDVILNIISFLLKPELWWNHWMI